MSLVGKRLRMARIFKDGKSLTVALDHGRRHGPIRGVEDLKGITRDVVEGGADAVMVTLPMIKLIWEEVAGRAAVIARIDGTGTVKGPDPSDDRVTASVWRAVLYGADAVSIMAYIGSAREADHLEKVGKVAEECESYGIPLMVEVIPSKPYLSDPYDEENIAYACRICVEHGADIVKTYYSGSPLTFRRVVERVPVPILILGGPKREDVKEVLKDVKGAIEGGAKGVAFGRNIFQYEKPRLMVRALREIIHREASVEEALNILRS